MLGIGGRDCYLDRMLILIKIIAAQIASALRSRVALQVENVLLRHQVEILRRPRTGTRSNLAGRSHGLQAVLNSPLTKSSLDEVGMV